MLITAGEINLKNKKRNKWKEYSFFPFNMMRKRWTNILIKELKKATQKHLKDNPDAGELPVFSHTPIMNAYFDTFSKINWYVHDSKQLPPETFNIAYVGRYTKRPPLAER